MNHSEEINLFRPYLFFLFLLYLLSSVLGVTFINDEFDAFKVFSLAFLGLPLLSVGVIIYWQLPHIFKYFKPYWPLYFFLLALSFFPGFLAVLNALGSSHVLQNQRALVGELEFARLSHPGLFGIPYQIRQF